MSEVDCPFELVEDKILETSRILLLNLGSRMLRGLKNQTTTDEHSALLLCVQAITKEQQLRERSSHQHAINSAAEIKGG
ncbi:hypothetical protein LCGC14_0442890 [marine sediment metagenome]|uniref:Uncharacterized protein n=1 Tax=marine sediment metagenome TaxID=412755 RepID=A0A0F9SR07_9ZZZZ